MKVFNSSYLQIRQKQPGIHSFLYSLVFLLICATAGGTAAAEPNYIGLTIEPHNVGVFYQNKTQQFRAYGHTAAGDKIDITEEVDWYIDPAGYPHNGQPETEGSVATIDETGLATVHNTWGRVVVYAEYPKGSRAAYRRSVAPLIQPLLLQKAGR